MLFVVLGVAMASVMGSAAVAAGLPDGRAYELVSSVDKHGADVMASSQRTRAATDGNAVSFGSLGAFADQGGMGIAGEFVSQRSTDRTPEGSGWQVHGITPKQEALSFFASFVGLEPSWSGEFSDDLSQGIFRAWSPLTDAPLVAQTENLYVRDDLLTPGSGSYRLVSDCQAPTACASPIALTTDDPGRVPLVAGRSDDFSHVLWETRQRLTDDAPPGRAPKLYEWVNGSVRYAGLPSMPAIAGSDAAAGGGGPSYTLRVITRDGSRLFFTVGASSSDTSGDLYMRDDRGTTDASDDTFTQLNSDPRLTGESGSGDGDMAARFQTASSGVDQGGNRTPVRVFFTTGAQLTREDTNSAVDLYMYTETADPVSDANLTLVSVDHAPFDDHGTPDPTDDTGDPASDVIGAIGASEDGRYVYFAADGQLASGEPALFADVGIYAWHDGATAYVGRMAQPGDTSIDLPGTWNLSPLRSRVTPDGRHLLFISHSGVGLTGYDQSGCEGGCTELYTYDADSATLGCASCNPDGTTATHPADVFVRDGTGAAVSDKHLNHPFSDDGRFLFFHTAEALVQDDANGKSDVYEYDTQTREVHLVSTGTDPNNAYFLEASTNGHDVFFITRQQLVGWDSDANLDVYDARVGGGFPEPPVVRACVRDACQPRSDSAPGSHAVGTAAFRGAGNVHERPHAPKHCKRGKVRKKVNGRVRCVKRKHRHTTRAQRSAR